MFRDYVRAVNNVDANRAYELLSSQAAGSSQHVQNILYKNAQRGGKIREYEIIDERSYELKFDENAVKTANLQVKIISEVNGLRLSNTHNIMFVWENEQWKMNEFVLL